MNPEHRQVPDQAALRAAGLSTDEAHQITAALNCRCLPPAAAAAAPTRRRRRTPPSSRRNSLHRGAHERELSR